MKVLQVNRFYSNRGGAETVLFQTIRLLERHGHEVVPFSMHDAANPPTEYSRYFVGKVDLRRSSASLARFSPTRWPLAGRVIYSREAEKNLEALVQASAPDLAHLHSIYHQLSPSVLVPLHRHGIPTVLTLHDYKTVCPSSLMFANGEICERCKGGKFYNAVIQGCVHDSRMKSAFCATESYIHSAWGAYRKYVDLYIAPSRFMKQKMTEFGIDGDRIVHVPNPLNLDAYTPGASSGDYFLFAGRLEKAKGAETLLKAIAGSEIASRFELRIAGEGKQRAELEAFCRSNGLNNVRFLGWLSQGELGELHQNALFAVVPSQWYEVFSLAVFEAQAYAKAVVGARIGGIPELIEEGRTGLLFEAGNPDDLRSKIEWLLLNPQRAEEMGKSAREVLEKRCAPEIQYRSLMEVYDRARDAHREVAAVAGGMAGEGVGQ